MLSKITPDAERWLKANLDLNINDLLKVEKDDKNFDTGKFLNDLKIKMKINKKKLVDLDISKSILDNLYFMRNEIISEMKAIDQNNSKKIKVFLIETLLLNKNIDGLNKSLINEIISIYNSNSSVNIEYMTFMDILLNDIKNIMNYDNLLNSSIKIKDKTLINSVSFKENKIFSEIHQ